MTGSKKGRLCRQNENLFFTVAEPTGKEAEMRHNSKLVECTNKIF